MTAPTPEVREAQEKRRYVLIERLGKVADLACDQPLAGDFGDVAYDLLRQAAAQISSDRFHLSRLYAALAPTPPAAPASRGKPVAWLKEWMDDGAERLRVDLKADCEPWLEAMKPTLTPLYAAPTPPAAPVGEREGLLTKFRALHDAARGREFDLTPEDGPIAQLTLFVHQHGDALIAALSGSASPEAGREGDHFVRALVEGPDLGAPTREPNLRDVIFGYYRPHYDLAGATRLTEAYIAALAPVPDAGAGDGVPETDVQYEVWQDAMMVAASDSAAEAEHYAAVYGQDGPVRLMRAETIRSAYTRAAPEGREG